MALKAIEYARLMEIIARRKVPERGINGEREIAPFAKWVEGFNVGHRHSAIEIILQIARHEPDRMHGDWKVEAQKRMDVCLDPELLGDIVTSEDVETAGEDMIKQLADWAGSPDEGEADAPGEGHEEVDDGPLGEVDGDGFPAGLESLVNTTAPAEVYKKDPPKGDDADGEDGEEK